ncbi:hypothetical protein PIIN_10170 [Serendipita indica DSM 11827]|uniref:Uncharacterized protein n=1 Tax=Serendipita indica (strain DSM 11827) TaxID=1109443 RepID=G4TXY4_SERID|nr:hypothetical protein PIIN_10170 [Serendipita indica DSM 11827]
MNLEPWMLGKWSPCMERVSEFFLDIADAQEADSNGKS